MVVLSIVPSIGVPGGFYIGLKHPKCSAICKRMNTSEFPVLAINSKQKQRQRPNERICCNEFVNDKTNEGIFTTTTYRFRFNNFISNIPKLHESPTRFKYFRAAPNADIATVFAISGKASAFSCCPFSNFSNLLRS